MEAIIFLTTLLIGCCHVGGDDCCYEYPCGTDKIDINCVRYYFLKSCECKSTSYTDGKPICTPHVLAYVPRIGLSVNVTDVSATYHGSKIVSFYYNNKTKRLVLAVDYSGLDLDSLATNFQIARKGQEPYEVKDYVKVTYGATLTASGPWGTHGVMPQHVTVSAYITEPNPRYKIGPCVTENKNPLVQQKLNEFYADRPTAVKELFLTKAYYFFWIWMQNYVCDFDYVYCGDVRN